MAVVTLKGAEFHTNGDLPAVGSQAPEFRLVAGDLSDVTLANYAGKKKLLNIVPSLDTPVCATSTRKFNEYAKSHPDTVILIVSADLPFAQSRFCAGRNWKCHPLVDHALAPFRQGLRRADGRWSAGGIDRPGGSGAGRE